MKQPVKKRYERNMMTLTPEENARLGSFKVCVVGCGGLGGYAIELLGRLGIGHITAIDGDVFDESNLNRQLLSDETAIGQSKAKAAKARMGKINSDVRLQAIDEFLTAENCESLISGHDAVIDALDNIDARLVLEKGAFNQGIPIVHGAIAGWYGQVSVILPGMKVFDIIYPEKARADAGKGIEAELGNPSFTPAMIASLQVCEAVKLLLNRENVLAGKLLAVDLLAQEYEIFELDEKGT